MLRTAFVVGVRHFSEAIFVLRRQQPQRDPHLLCGTVFPEFGLRRLALLQGQPHRCNPDRRNAWGVPDIGPLHLFERGAQTLADRIELFLMVWWISSVRVSCGQAYCKSDIETASCIPQAVTPKIYIGGIARGAWF